MGLVLLPELHCSKDHRVLVNNDEIDIPVYELPLVVTTRDNAKEVFANDPGHLELLKWAH